MLKQANCETCSENTDGSCTVLYFDTEVTKEEVQQALREIKACEDGTYRLCPLVTSPDDEWFSYQKVQTPVADAAGWHRYECYGSS